LQDSVQEKWRAIVGEIQSDPNYADAVNTLYGLARKYFEITKDEVVKAAQDSSAKLKEVDADPNQEAKNAVSLLRQIIENFTGPLDPALQALDALYNDVKADERVQQVWKEFDVLLDRSINDPGYVSSSRASRQFDAIYNRARAIVESNAEFVPFLFSSSPSSVINAPPRSWKRDASAFSNEASKLFNHAANDRALIAVGDAFEDLGDSLALFGKTGYNLFSLDGGDLWKGA
jgi:hypothetical protein